MRTVQDPAPGQVIRFLVGSCTVAQVCSCEDEVKELLGAVCGLRT